MSEPSLRDTAIEQAAQAIVGVSETGRPFPVTDFHRITAAQAVDAALSVIHTQRDNIAQALKPYISCPDDGIPEDCLHCANERDLAADAVLAVLGEPDD